MKKLLACVLIVILLCGCAPASKTTVSFKLKVPYPLMAEYYICAGDQDEKVELDLENTAYTEDSSGNRIYDVTVRCPGEVTVQDDGRSFWTLYAGYISENSETFSNTLKNVGIRSGSTTVDMEGGKVFYDPTETIYTDENFTLYVDEGMITGSGSMLYDVQFVWCEENGEQEICEIILPGATVQLLAQNAPNAKGDVYTWFSVVSGAEGIGETSRFSVLTKGQTLPESSLTLDALPDVVSDEGAKWLSVSEFAADGIKPDTDVAVMKETFGEPELTRKEYESDADYMIYHYDGVEYSFETALDNGDEWLEKNQAFTAEFSENLLEFPRGIRIGDSFADVLKKFPQELDYKNDVNDGLFYGDYWRKDKLGWGAVHIANSTGDGGDGVWISVICDEYWPMLQVHFTDDLIADKIVVQFWPSPYYN